MIKFELCTRAKSETFGIHRSISNQLVNATRTVTNRYGR